MVTSLKVRLNTARCDKEGRYPLGFQLLKNGRKRIIPLGVSLREEWFDKHTESVKVIPACYGGRKRKQAINEEIGRVRRQLVDLVAWLMRYDPSFTVVTLAGAYRRRLDNRCFAVFVKQECARLVSAGRHGTNNQYKSLLNSVERFCKHVRPGETLLWNQITEGFVTDYRRYLEESGLMGSSVATYLSLLRTLYRRACKTGICAGGGDIFRGNFPRILSSEKRAAGAGWIRRLLDAPLDAFPGLAPARDVFAASLYMEGMAVRDLMNLQRKNVRDGVITYRRSKTGKILVFRIVPELQQLLDKYASADSHLFPFLLSDSRHSFRDYKTALRRLNRHLFRLEQLLDLPFHLSTYVARHSWASLAQRCNAPIEKISQALGHTSTKTTQIYLKGFNYRAIDEVNETVIRCFR